MTVKIYPARNGKPGRWEYSIRFKWAEDGTIFRERRDASFSGKHAAQRWAEARERALLNAGKDAYAASKLPPMPVKAIPTLAEFAPRWIENYARANRQKPSTIHAKEQILRTHLVPMFGAKRLNEITDEDVQALKASVAKRKPKTANNVLSTLGTLLRIAVEWNEIPAMPCRIRLLKAQNLVVRFYETDEYKRLVIAAGKHDVRTLVMVLLGGDAGLRLGEIIGLRWCDVDFARGHLKIEEAVWRGQLGTTKGNKSRIIPMTAALTAALKQARHLRGDRVLWRDNGRGKSVTRGALANWLGVAERRAGLKVCGALHKLRHTFGSHLAMRGASPKAIQDLMGHEHLTTTQRYLHLSPSARRGAIDLLNDRDQIHGATVEQAASETA